MVRWCPINEVSVCHPTVTRLTCLTVTNDKRTRNVYGKFVSLEGIGIDSWLVLCCFCGACGLGLLVVTQIFANHACQKQALVVGNYRHKLFKWAHRHGHAIWHWLRHKLQQIGGHVFQNFLWVSKLKTLWIWMLDTSPTDKCKTHVQPVSVWHLETTDLFQQKLNHTKSYVPINWGGSKGK